MNYRMIIQYDGTRFQGWQRQKSGKEEKTIQGRIENVLSKWMGESIEICGAGRTDAGVHALGQVANVELEEAKVEAPYRIQSYLNEYLPEDIRIIRVEEAGNRFHSRYHATGKTYAYHLLKANCFDVFRRKYAWQMEQELDVNAMREAAEHLLGSHDFAGFCSKASKKKSTVRTIHEIQIEENENEIILRYTGNGFLYNMVRILTGTLVEVGCGERAAAQIPELIACKERKQAGVTAPAQGLFLEKVYYD